MSNDVPILRPPLAPADATAAAAADVARLGESLDKTGVAVAAFDAFGRVVATSPGLAPFFGEYAIPAFGALGPTAVPIDLPQRIDDSACRVPGVTCVVLPAVRRGGPPVTIVMFARSSAFDARDAAVASRLATTPAAPSIDRLASIASEVPAPSPEVVDQLAMLSFATLRGESRLAAVQGELDAVSNQLSETYEELTLIYQISSGMRVNRSVDDFFLQACTDVIDVLNVRGAGYVVTDAGGGVDASSSYGELRLPTEVATRLGVDLLARFGKNAKPMLANDLAADPILNYLAGHATRLVAVAVQRQDKLLGTLFCLDKRERDFTTQDSKLLNSIGNETAIYLENRALFGDARELTMGLLHALTSAVDAKDAYTCGHSHRVALFGREIASHAGLPEAFCERVYMAGLLHDVGKIGVPEDVLRKPGKLTNEEFDLMRRHVDIGRHILKDLRQIEDLLPGVLYHHERYDGRGYPHNLAGQDIPLIARILCVADCFDAMTSNRTYRKALPVEVAMMEIRRCAGTQFDPRLADALLSIGEQRLRTMIQAVIEPMPTPNLAASEPMRKAA